MQYASCVKMYGKICIYRKILEKLLHAWNGKKKSLFKTYYDFGNDFGLAERFEEKGKEATDKED